MKRLASLLLLLMAVTFSNGCGILGWGGPKENSGYSRTFAHNTPFTYTNPDQRRAYFIVQGENLRDSTWVAHVSQYKVFVCNPSFSNRDLKILRDASPDCICLMYTNAMMIPLGKYNSPYYKELDRLFSRDFCLRSTTRDYTFSSYEPNTPQSQFAMVLTQNSSLALIGFFEDYAMARTDWDGFYIDMFVDGIPNWIRNNVNSQLLPGEGIDYNQDGRTDSWEDMDQADKDGKLLFSSLLRERFPNHIIIANTRILPEPNPNLNGVCIENIGTGTGAVSWLDAVRFFSDQERVSARPIVSIAYGNGSCTYATQIAKYYQWVYVGDIVGVNKCF